MGETTTTTTPARSSSEILDSISGGSNTPTGGGGFASLFGQRIGMSKGAVPSMPSQYSPNDANSVGTPMPQAPYTWTNPAKGKIQQGYVPGDEFIPSSWGAPTITGIQDQLASTGFLKAGSKFQRGVWDQPTVAAYRELLGYANNQGLSDVTAIAQISGQQSGLASVDENGQVIAGGAAKPTVLTNSKQLKGIIKAAGVSVLGKELDDATAEKLVKTFHQQEIDAANQATSPEGTVEQAPSADEGWFEQQLRELMPNTAKSNDIFKGLSSLQNNIGAPVAQVYHG